MAFGKHWEWRGFGRVDRALKRRIQAWPALLEEDWRLADHYLWAPGCSTNVKLREGSLKLKRFIAPGQEDDLECWLEDQADLHPFPLTPAVLAKLQTALSVVLPWHPPEPLPRDQLLALLPAAHPPVQVIAVEKARQLYELQIAGRMGQAAAAVTVELTQITGPERIASVALEHPEAGPVQAAKRWLGLDDSSLQPLNYLRALDIWAQGERILSGQG